VNNVSLIGTLVHDPEVKVGRDGRDVCLLQIEVPRRRPTGELEPGVIYVDLSTFGPLARKCASRLSAGMWVGVSGTLERDDSLDSRGPRRSRWEVHAHQIDVLPHPASA
jgi:single-stranded DNA-binding protein